MKGQDRGRGDERDVVGKGGSELDTNQRRRQKKKKRKEKEAGRKRISMGSSRVENGHCYAKSLRIRVKSGAE